MTKKTQVFWGVESEGRAGSASGRSDAAGDCLEAPGSSEPGEHMEAPGDGRAWRDVLERCGTPAAGS